MNETMNKQQIDYIIAEAHLEVLKEMSRESQQVFIKSKGIQNEDGSIPEMLWRIKDEKLFEECCKEYDSIEQNVQLDNDIIKAREQFVEAEEELYKFAISICPGGLKEQLREATTRSYKAKEEMLKTVLKLDTSTINIQEGLSDG